MKPARSAPIPPPPASDVAPSWDARAEDVLRRVRAHIASLAPGHQRAAGERLLAQALELERMRAIRRFEAGLDVVRAADAPIEKAPRSCGLCGDSRHNVATHGRATR